MSAEEAGSPAVDIRNPTTSPGLRVARASLLQLPVVVDPAAPERGSITFANFASDLPFVPARYFVVSVSGGGTRGAHAHRLTRMALQCMSGEVWVELDDGRARQGVLLRPSGPTLVLDALVWSDITYRHPNSTLLALCSTEHDPSEYIHDYEEFRQAVADAGEEERRKSACLGAAVVVPFLDTRAAAAAVAPALHAAFERVLRSGRYVLGEEVVGFEAEWAAYCGAAHCVGVGSGLAALHLLLLAAGVGPGDEVIVPANTYIATLLAVSHAGATPVLVEPHPTTRNIDPRRVEAAVTPATKSILAVDLYGLPADYEALEEITTRRGLSLFADAAQSHGARAAGSGRRVGSLCRATAFSFYPSKNLGALGEAGAVVTDDAALADRLRALRNYGSRERYSNDERGFNERMDPLQAAFLRVKLAHLDAWNAARAHTAARYLAALAGEGGWLTLPLAPQQQPSWHLFVVECAQRDDLRAHLAACGVETMVHYPTPPHLSAAYADLGTPRGSFPMTERLADTVLSLPICPFLRPEQVDAVIAAVLSFPKRRHCHQQPRCKL